MKHEWGIVGCAYMAQEYCKVFTSRGLKPRVYSRNLNSSNVTVFEALFPDLKVEQLGDASRDINKWIVCTNIASHEQVCSLLQGQMYCEKPYAHTADYKSDVSISMLMNRRYYYWVGFIKNIIDAGRIVKIVASVPEKNIDALIPQTIHVIDLIWYLAGQFEAAARFGDVMPAFVFNTKNNIPVVINMNYGAHENFSIRFYERDGTVYEAKPLEFIAISEGMAVREPDATVPIRTYSPVVRSMPYLSTGFKPGLAELVEDLIADQPTRLPTLREHRNIHAWMEGNML
jgi:predicted dehydrogenase